MCMGSPECRTHPYFAEEGQTAKFCLLHRLPDHVDVRNKRCGDPASSSSLAYQEVVVLSVAFRGPVLRHSVVPQVEHTDRRMI